LIISSAAWKFFIRRFTSCTVVPLPAAIRLRRLPFRTWRCAAPAPSSSR
jgi:hypothetical protein